MSIVRGHWRKTSDGNVTWVKEHFRNVSSEPTPLGCGGILVSLYLLFMAPYHILGTINAICGTTIMGGSNELNDWIPLCVTVFVILIILFIVGWVTEISILQYLPLIIVLVSLIAIFIALLAGILEVFKIIGNFINQFR